MRASEKKSSGGAKTGDVHARANLGTRLHIRLQKTPHSSHLLAPTFPPFYQALTHVFVLERFYRPQSCLVRHNFHSIAGVGRSQWPSCRLPRENSAYPRMLGRLIPCLYTMDLHFPSFPCLPATLHIHRAPIFPSRLSCRFA